MKFPPQLQQKIEKWASSQGISTEQFVLQAVAEKIDALTQQTAEATNVVSSNQPNIYRKKGILVVDVLIAKDNPWQSLIDSLDNFSDDFMTTRDQPILDARESF